MLESTFASYEADDSWINATKAFQCDVACLLNLYSSFSEAAILLELNDWVRRFANLELRSLCD